MLQKDSSDDKRQKVELEGVEFKDEKICIGSDQDGQYKNGVYQKDLYKERVVHILDKGCRIRSCQAGGEDSRT